MTILAFTAIIGTVSIGAGLLGSLTGLGGGIIIVPLLTSALGVDIHFAIGSSLIAVIATSSGSAIESSKEGFANIRIGMFLEIAATIGALTGTVITAYIAPKWVAVIFGLVLIHSAYMTISKKNITESNEKVDILAARLHLNGEYTSGGKTYKYNLRSVPGGFFVMYIAGIVSGLLGIGSGALKVIGMDRMMRIPFKVSTATSNFMIGITAVASAGIYLHRGYIEPGLAMPVMLGVLTGAVTGTRYLKKAKTKTLRVIFSVTIIIMGIQMIYKGFAGNF